MEDPFWQHVQVDKGLASIARQPRHSAWTATTQAACRSPSLGVVVRTQAALGAGHGLMQRRRAPMQGAATPVLLPHQRWRWRSPADFVRQLLSAARDAAPMRDATKYGRAMMRRRNSGALARRDGWVAARRARVVRDRHGEKLEPHAPCLAPEYALALARVQPLLRAAERHCALLEQPLAWTIAGTHRSTLGRGAAAR